MYNHSSSGGRDWEVCSLRPKLVKGRGTLSHMSWSWSVLTRLANNTVRMAKGDAKKSKDKISSYASFEEMCREYKKKKPKSPTILQNFPRNPLGGGRECLGKRNLKYMKWQKQKKYAMNQVPEIHAFNCGYLGDRD
jgi:hypothetical protein